MMKLPEITRTDFLDRLGTREKPWRHNYLTMYSTQWGGFTTDPDLMLIPVDDHLVHRGDGVFDVMRCVDGKIYQMEEHLKRLNRSARAISLSPPEVYADIRELIRFLVRKGGLKDCLIRLVLSRGPGSFTANPFDCPESQLYVNVIRFKGLPETYYREGISIITSRIPIKKSFFATIKSCDYLPNVLMKMEAIEAGCGYSVGLDEKGFLAEGSTENLGIITVEGVLKFPGLDTTLSGITEQRVFELARQLVQEGHFKDAVFGEIPPEEAYQAREVFLTGTSLDILPVVRFDSRTIGDGTPGPGYARLHRLLREDMRNNERLLTPVNWEDAQ